MCKWRDWHQVTGNLLFWFPTNGWIILLPRALPAYHSGPGHRSHRGAWVLPSAPGALGCPVSSHSEFVINIFEQKHVKPASTMSVLCYLHTSYENKLKCIVRKTVSCISEWYTVEWQKGWRITCFYCRKYLDYKTVNNWRNCICMKIRSVR